MWQKGDDWRNLHLWRGRKWCWYSTPEQARENVDAVFRPKSEIMDAARIIAEDMGLPVDWLNDSVKGFLSHNEKLKDEPIEELEGLSHLRITWPTAEYLLAMKCLAARSEETSQDRQDVEFLIRSLGLTTEKAVLEIVEQFYPQSRIHVKTRYFVEEIIAGMKQDAKLHQD